MWCQGNIIRAKQIKSHPGYVAVALMPSLSGEGHDGTMTRRRRWLLDAGRHTVVSATTRTRQHRSEKPP